MPPFDPARSVDPQYPIQVRYQAAPRPARTTLPALSRNSSRPSPVAPSLTNSGRDRAMATPTFAELRIEYLRRHLPHKKPGPAAEDARMWAVLLQKLGPDCPLQDPDLPERILALHLAYKDRPYQGNRLLNLLSSSFELAATWGWAVGPTNPCCAVPRYPERVRRRFFSCGEVASLLRAARELEDEGRITLTSGDALRLLTLTGARKGEILPLRWEWVDLLGRIAHLPDSKTGPRTLYFSKPAASILERRRGCDRVYVLPGHRRNTPLRGLQRAWARCCERAGLKNARVHDLRRTFAALVLRSGYSLFCVGELLGHRDERTTRAYSHLDDSILREATDSVARALPPWEITDETDARHRRAACGDPRP